VRVLDLTRVIAGPVCTRYLGALGAEVLRLDPPRHLDVQPGDVADTLLAKRSAFLDVSTSGGMAALHGLLDDADVVVCGYRPGALDGAGLGEDALIERHAGLVVVYLDAWGHSGPWAARRGFDSVVQAASGIADCESGADGAAETDETEPGALPCQLLDHGTGYLAAAAVLDGLRRQRTEGGTHIRRLSLARSAAWLTDPSVLARIGAGSPPQSSSEADVEPWLQEVDTADGSVVAVRPPGAIDGRPLQWSGRATRYGEDAPVWQ
jgi:crotonobetainyl-CoA:carnitine CoA-transferase CaiB-like acyl-CoA transferase